MDADCSTSTKSKIFQHHFPDDFINVGIAEQNMIGIAAGLSLRGKIPIVNGFSKMLIMRAFEQLNDLCGLQKVKIILVGHYSGVSAALEGATHHSISDVSLLKNINGISILTPGNIVDLKQCIEYALITNESSYIRLSKNKMPLIHLETIKKNYGFNYESIILNELKNKVILISVGFCYMQSIKVSEWLKNNNINHIIVSIWNYQIIDYHELCKLIEKDNLVIIIDEHKKYGSIGNDIETNLKEKNINNIKLLCIDNEVITDTGDYEYLIEKYKIDSNAIKKIIIEEITNEKK